MLRDRFLDKLIGALNRIAVHQIELHTAYVGLVCDCFGVQLQYYRVANRVCSFCGVLCAGGNARFNRRNAVSGQQLFRLGFGKDRASRVAGFFDYLSRLLPVRLADRIQPRRFVQRAQVIAVLAHIVERSSSGIRISISGNVDSVQNVNTCLDIGTSHPAGKHRFAFNFGIWLQLFRSYCRIGHILRCKDNEHAVRIRIFSGNFERFGIPVRSRITEDIDRIASAPVGRQQTVQCVKCFFADFRKLPAFGD